MIGKHECTYNHAILSDHVRQRLPNLDYPGLIRREGSSVAGIVVSGVTDEQLDRLDLFEGDEYQRKAVEVRLVASTAMIACQAYIYMDPNTVLAESWDFQEFETFKSHRWTSTSNEYDMLLDNDCTGGSKRPI